MQFPLSPFRRITPEDALLLRFFARYGRGGPYVIRVGEYAFEPGISVVGALKLLASGKALLRELRVSEGTPTPSRFTQLREVLNFAVGSFGLAFYLISRLLTAGLVIHNIHLIAVQ